MKQKIKIMKQKPELSDEEIRSYMDFDGLVANKKLLTGEATKLYWMKRIMPIVAISVIGVWFIFYKPDTKTQPHAESVAQNSEVSTDEKPSGLVKEEVKEEAVTQEPSQSPQQSNDGEHKLKEPSAVIPKNAPLTDTYIQAEPLEGYDALYEYFNEQLVYPAESVKDSIQGVQTITFVINSDGKPVNVQIRQSLGELFEKEARRLIENMPAWKPATLNGKAVASQISLPLTFHIQKLKTK